MSNKTVNNRHGLEHWKKVTLALIAYDVITVSFSYFAALLLRFDFAFSRIPVVYFQSWLYFAPIYAVICIVIFSRLRLYKSIWRFASFTELERIIVATIITTGLHFIGSTITINLITKGTPYTMMRMPFSYYIIGAIIQTLLVTAVRFSYRFILLLRASRDKKSAAKIMLVGLNSIIGTT